MAAWPHQNRLYEIDSSHRSFNYFFLIWNDTFLSISSSFYIVNSDFLLGTFVSVHLTIFLYEITLSYLSLTLSTGKLYIVNPNHPLGFNYFFNMKLMSLSYLSLTLFYRKFINSEPESSVRRQVSIMVVDFFVSFDWDRFLC